jgi:riboflavin-specific deaminase-like protein
MRPRVICNFALSLDGKVTTRGYSPSGFAGPHDKKRFAEIRALGDGLLVGARTVAADNMSMGVTNPNHRAARAARGQSVEPLRAIASASGRINPAWKVFQNGRSPLVIFTSHKAPRSLRHSLPDFCDLWIVGDRQVDPATMLEILRREYKIKRLVCEGGPTLFRALASNHAIDELFLTYTGKIFGGSKAPTLTGLPTPEFLESMEFRFRKIETVEGELFLHMVACRTQQ